MDPIGMDVHTKESQICILTEAGELIGARLPGAEARRGAAGGRGQTHGKRWTGSGDV